MSQKLLVVGATGSIGRLVVEFAHRSGYRVRALVRNPSGERKLAEISELVQGDLTQCASLAPALDGVDSIIFTHGTYGDPRAAASVDYGAVRNVLLALKGRAARIALMSTIGATDRRGSHDWKRRGERLVRVSGLPYTIVRPGWFDYDKPVQRQLVMIQGDTRVTGTPLDGVVARIQVAEVLVRSLRSPEALRKTLELHAEAGDQQSDLDALFKGLAPDASGSVDGVLDKANMPFDQEPSCIRQEYADIQALYATGKAWRS